MTRFARFLLGCPCAGLPWLAWYLVHRTDCTALLNISLPDLSRVQILRENTLNDGPFVRLSLLHAWQGFLTNGTACTSVQSLFLHPNSLSMIYPLFAPLPIFIAMKGGRHACD